MRRLCDNPEERIAELEAEREQQDGELIRARQQVSALEAEVEHWKAQAKMMAAEAKLIEDKEPIKTARIAKLEREVELLLGHAVKFDNVAFQAALEAIRAERAGRGE